MSAETSIRQGTVRTCPDCNALNFNLYVLYLRGNSVCAHIGTQRLREQHRTVGLLVVFDNGELSAPYGETRAVERMHEFTLPALGFAANPATPRLKRLAV